MSKFARESWVTVGSNDEEALQALVLASSLKAVRTNRAVSIIVSADVSPAFRFILKEEFDEVASQPTIQEIEAKYGGVGNCNQKWTKGLRLSVNNADLWVRRTLRIWNKCVYLSPNAFVLENCDHLFDCPEFSWAGTGPELFVFYPRRHATTTWDNILQPDKNDDQVAVIENSPRSESLRVDNLIHYGKDGDDDACVDGMGKICVHQPQQPSESTTWILNSVRHDFLEAFTRDVGPRILAFKSGELRTYMTEFVEKLGLPLVNPTGQPCGAPILVGDVLDDSIAIVGMSCRFAESNNVDEFWTLLAEGRNGVAAFPPGRVNTYETTDVDGVEGGFLKCPVDEFDAKFFGISPREAELIDPQQRLLLIVIWEALEDAGIPPGSLKNSTTGAYLGIWRQDYEKHVSMNANISSSSPSDFHHRYLGNAFSATSARISHFLGLVGPNIALESGCSSSLAALHLACESLRRGEISLAISSGANLALGVAHVHGEFGVGDEGPESSQPMGIVLSKDYRCKTFDESADGFVRAEGVGALILKRAADAVLAGDNILALIRGSAMNNDGAGTSFGTPNAESQEKVIREALKNSGVLASDVSYVEAHGTGTAVGDPIEMYALGQVYSQGRSPANPLHIGSVKTNIGHSESASGMAGIIKTILAMQHKQIPPHLNLKTLNPRIDLEAIPAVIPSKLTDWTTTNGHTKHSRLAGVSSISMSGTNVHVILQEAPPGALALATSDSKAMDGDVLPHLITLSAKSYDSLQALADKYLTYLIENPNTTLADFAYTTNVCRAHNFNHRLALVSRNGSVDEIVAQLKQLTTTPSSGAGPDCLNGRTLKLKPKVVFLFPGQGCQYVGMARDLFQTSAPFAAAFERCNQMFGERLDGGGVSLADVIWKDDDQHCVGRLTNTIYGQPALFCLQYCLLTHWNSFGVRPDVVLGHSVGEFAAAVAAGVFSLEEAFELVQQRSILVSKLPKSVMLILYAGHEKVQSVVKSFHQDVESRGEQHEPSWVDVAAINSPAEVVVSLSTHTAQEFEEFCVNNHVKTQRLASAHGFHSRAMDPILKEFEEAVCRVLTARSRIVRNVNAGTALTCQYISGARATTVEMEQLLEPKYWTQHLRETVKFADAVQLITATSQPSTTTILLEIGPQPVLLALTMVNLDNKHGGEQPRAAGEFLYCPSLRRTMAPSGRHIHTHVDWNQTLTTLSRLYVLGGLNIDWNKWYLRQNYRPSRLRIPTYVFDRERHWYDRQGDLGEQGAVVGGTGKLIHPVLGRQVPSPLSETIYTQFISTTSLPYVVDHKVGGKIILPGAVYLEAALAVGKQLLCGGGGEDFAWTVPISLNIHNLSIQAALEIEEKKAVQLQTIVKCNRADAGSTHLEYNIGFHRPLLASQAENSWKCQANATFLPVAHSCIQPQTTLDIQQLKAQLTERTGGSEGIGSLYAALVDTGIEFGPRFQSIQAAWRSRNELLTLVPVPQLTSKSSSDYICHPILIDAMIQTLAFRPALNGDSIDKDDRRLRLPLNIRSFSWIGRPVTTQNVYLYAKAGEDGDEGKAVISMYDESGQLLAVLQGLELIKVSVDSFIRAIRAEAVPIPSFYKQTWTPLLGIQNYRHDLPATLENVTCKSERTMLKLRDFSVNVASDEFKAGLRRINLMCFYYMVKCIHECGWSWPSTSSTLTYGDWEPYVGQTMKGARLHVSFMTAFTEEGYLRLDDGGAVGQHTILRPLPTLDECHSEILAIHQNMSGLLDQDKLFGFTLTCAQQLGAVVRGETSALSVLFPSDASQVGITSYYQESAVYVMQSEAFVAVFGDLVDKLVPPLPSSSVTENEARARTYCPNVLRILEVGAGTGATSEKLIALLQESGIRFEYTFTDISSQFLEHARNTFGTEHMKYGLLNIEHDPLAQGYCPQYYDIVLAAQVIHATENLETSLTHLRTLLRPSGALLLVEQLETSHFAKISFALLEGWWRFNDFRTNSPIVDGHVWEQLLNKLRFSDVNVIHIEGTIGVGLIFARAPPIITETAPTRHTWILFGQKSSTSGKICCRLEAMGRNCVHVRSKSGSTSAAATGLEQNEYEMDFENGQQFQQMFQNILNHANKETILEGVVYLSINTTKDDLDCIRGNQAANVRGLLHFLQAMSSHSYCGTTNKESTKLKPKVFVLTRGVHHFGDAGVGHPANATVWGAFRSFINECREFSCCIIDLEQQDDEDEDEDVAVDEVTAQLWSTPNALNNASSAYSTDAEKFILVRDGHKYGQRLGPMPIPNPSLALPLNTERYAFINPVSGSLSDIQIGPEVASNWPTTTALNELNVEVEVRAVALNFRDLLCVLKPPGFARYVKPDQGGNYSVGADISGLVVSVGNGVTKFQVGDHVFGFTRTGGLKSHTITQERFLMRKPKEMTFIGAATIPVVFLTSYHCLINLANLSANDRLLIHVASGGVGLSAIQIAQRIGATIYATAGNKRKRAYLRTHLGLVHVYNSRNLDYGAEIMRDTHGAGVTVVLNSLTSPGFKETTLDACANGAQFIEIGKLNTWTVEDILERRPDVRYSIVDLAAADEATLETIGRTFDKVEQPFEDGSLRPLPATVFALERLRDAFYYFQEAKHIGKIVVRMPSPELSPAGRLVLKHRFFNAESTYLITGGLGGLGIEVTKWMCSTGAKHVVLVGRNAPSSAIKTYLEQLSSDSGCQILTFQTDVGDFGQCAALLKEIKTMGCPPLRGIFQAAGVLADSLIPNQSWEKFDAVFNPKVYGSLWLHKLTLGYDLEFFTMFSSLASFVGMMGQATHTAASNFLDALAHYRNSTGLPGASINWGAWSDVGAAAFLRISLEGVIGLRAFTPTQGIAALEQFILQNYNQAAVLEVPDWAVIQQLFNLGAFLDDIRPAVSSVGLSAAEFEKIVAEIEACPPEEKQDKIQDYLELILKQTLRLKPSDLIDPDQNFSELGVDSLMAMEMRNRLNVLVASSNKPVTIEALQENRTLRSLSTHLAKLLNSTEETEEERAKKLWELLHQDTKLSDDICDSISQIVQGGQQPTPTAEIKEILLTGSTGFLGSHILALLLNETRVKVHCLVRSDSVFHGQTRLQEAFNKFKVFESESPVLDPSRVAVVPGDVAEPELGLDQEAYNLLSSSVDAVIHCAVKSNHLESYSAADESPNSLRRQNVVGLLNVLRFVIGGAKAKHFCHASTLLSATEQRDGGILAEELPTIDNYTPSLKNGYSLSKWVGDVLIGEAVRAGLRNVKVIRYPGLWGHSQTGFIALNNSYNHGWNIVTECMRLRKFPLTDEAVGITVVPIDVAARLTLELVLGGDKEDGTYNMTTETIITSRAIQNVVADRGLQVEFLPETEWRNQIFGSDDQNNGNLQAFRWLYEDDADGQLRGRQFHPFLSQSQKQDDVGGGGPQFVMNVISDKMKRNVAVDNLKWLTMPATDVINRHLDCYLDASSNDLT